MPPKRARGSIRGRGGRGRGRGASEAPPATAHPNAGSPAAEHGSPAKSHTPQLSQDEMDIDSPPTQPTETPAPTPVKPAHILPPPSIASGTAGTTAKAPSRFVPKAKRRNEKERQELEDAERLRKKGISDESARIAARSNALRARGGRGDAMGRGRMMATGPASGAFAAMPASGKSIVQFSKYILMNC
jgi:DNA-directed RNA polymerase III subunit RPC4